MIPQGYAIFLIFVNPQLLIISQRHFGNQNADIIDKIQPNAPDHPVVLAYEVPDDIDVLYFVIIDRDTGEMAKIHLQPLVSKQEQRYEGEFINAPARE